MKGRGTAAGSAFLFSVLAALLVLAYGLAGLYLGHSLTTDTLAFLYGRVVTARTTDLVPAIALFVLAVGLLTYGVYGLHRGGIRNILPARGGARDTTYYQGLPMWCLFLSFLSLAVYVIASAVSLVCNDGHAYRPRNAWKWNDVDNVPLFLSLGLLFVAGWLDSAIGGRGARDLWAAFRERFGSDSEHRKALRSKGIAFDRKTFFAYIAENDAEIVTLFLDAGMAVDGADPLGTDTPLSSAARHGHKELVTLLLGRKADVNKAAPRGLPPLWSTVYDFDDTAILRSLVRHHADVGVRNADGETVLMRAAAALSHDTVAFLLDNGADINARAEDGHTALVCAVERTGYETVDGRDVVEGESYGMVKYLLEHGADPNARLSRSDSKNDTPLRIARSSRKVKEVATLLEEHRARE